MINEVGAAGQMMLTLDTAIAQAEGYRLTISAERIVIAGHDLAGVFYGVQTLRQLLLTAGSTLPQMVIDDWPDFPARAADCCKWLTQRFRWRTCAPSWRRLKPSFPCCGWRATGPAGWSPV